MLGGRCLGKHLTGTLAEAAKWWSIINSSNRLHRKENPKKNPKENPKKNPKENPGPIITGLVSFPADISSINPPLSLSTRSYSTQLSSCDHPLPPRHTSPSYCTVVETLNPPPMRPSTLKPPPMRPSTLKPPPMRPSTLKPPPMRPSTLNPCRPGKFHSEWIDVRGNNETVTNTLRTAFSLRNASYVTVSLALEVDLARGMVYRHVLVCCGSWVATNLNGWLCPILAEA
jgi:hypothetical protein